MALPPPQGHDAVYLRVRELGGATVEVVELGIWRDPVVDEHPRLTKPGLNPVAEPSSCETGGGHQQDVAVCRNQVLQTRE